MTIDSTEQTKWQMLGLQRIKRDHLWSQWSKPLRTAHLGVTKVAMMHPMVKLSPWAMLILKQSLVYITRWRIQFVCKLIQVFNWGLFFHRSLNIQQAPAVSLTICLSGWKEREILPSVGAASHWFHFNFFVPDQEMCFFCSQAQENEKRKTKTRRHLNKSYRCSDGSADNL